MTIKHEHFNGTKNLKESTKRSILSLLLPQQPSCLKKKKKKDLNKSDVNLSRIYADLFKTRRLLCDFIH